MHFSRRSRDSFSLDPAVLWRNLNETSLSNGMSLAVRHILTPRILGDITNVCSHRAHRCKRRSKTSVDPGVWYLPKKKPSRGRSGAAARQQLAGASIPDSSRVKNRRVTHEADTSRRSTTLAWCYSMLFAADNQELRSGKDARRRRTRPGVDPIRPCQPPNTDRDTRS